ncbi:conserved protein of unknown function [Streptomyces murinus]
MPAEPAPGPTRRALSPFDHRIEAVTGHDIDTLWTYRDRGVLDEPHAHLVDRHRELAQSRGASLSTSVSSTASPAVSSRSMKPCSRASTGPWASWRTPRKRGTPQPGR